MHRLDAELHAAGEQRLTVDQAADIVSATDSPGVSTLPVIQRGWIQEQYGQWLADSWELLLLDAYEPRRVGPSRRRRRRRG